MIEHILLDNGAEQRQQERSVSKKSWFGFVFGSLALVAATCALVFVLSNPAESADASSPVLSTENVCDACTLYPDLTDHVTCRSCPFRLTQTKELKCPAGYGNMRFSEVRKGRKKSATGLVQLQKSCDAQYANFDASSNEAFSCSILMKDFFPMVPEPRDQPEEPEQEEQGEGEEPVLSSAECRNGFTAKFTCEKVVDQNLQLVQAESSSALFLSQTLVAEPFLSNVQIKCGKTKHVSGYTEVTKMCETSNSFTASCNSGNDARIIFLKFKETGSKKSKKAKKAGKARAALATNFCTGNNWSGNTCTFASSDILLEETEDLTGVSFDIKYVCSYGELLTTTEAPAMLSSALEQPSELFLQSALLKCGKQKMMSDAVQIGKVCNDVDFNLSCDANGQDARVIVLGFWSGKKTKEGKRVARKRASKATDLCNSSENFSNNACSFSLADVYLEGESETDFVDTTFNVKYLCSFSAPLSSGL